MIDRVREVALKVLYKIDKENAFSNIVLNQELKDIRKKGEQLTPRDVGFISEIVYGVTNWRLTIDHIIETYATIKLKKISPWIMNILRMGVYQIVWLDKIPKSAAVNESVNLAKRYGHSGSSKFVNAILHKITKEDYHKIKQIADNKQRISLMYAMPMWIIEQLLKERKTIKEVETICQELTQRPTLTIRRNQLKIQKKEFEDQLTKAQIIFENSTINPDFYYIQNMKQIEQLDLFQNGDMTVQDVSAGLAAYYLDPKPGDKILDACSAPGGKTTYLAELMGDEGRIEAWDIHPHRTKLIEENAKRLGIKSIETKVQDASQYHSEYQETFDKILLDVPCLGLGVIKRKPDIKWQKKSKDLEEITKIQNQILEVCTKYLKPGGKLVYSTCSILQEENEKIVEKFIKNHAEFFVEEVIPGKKMLQILPQMEQDGFFIAKITKNNIT